MTGYVSESVENKALFELAAAAFIKMPHSQALGIKFVEASRGRAVTFLPFASQLIGNINTHIVHGGVMTTLIDTTCGLTVFSLLEEPEQVVTLDLRIDYLRAAAPDSPIYCVAECYRLTRHIAFLRATTYQDKEQTIPVAHGVSTFMRTPLKKREVHG